MRHKLPLRDAEIKRLYEQLRSDGLCQTDACQYIFELDINQNGWFLDYATILQIATRGIGHHEGRIREGCDRKVVRQLDLDFKWNDNEFHFINIGE